MIKRTHPFERLQGFGYVLLANQPENGWVAAKIGKTTGRIVWRTLITGVDNFSPLNKCDLCGMVHGPKKVQVRNDVYSWNKQYDNDCAPLKNMLCMGCWNRVLALVRQSERTAEQRTLINKTVKELRDERRKKHSDYRPVA
jgi:hypothetical protein